MGSVFYNKNQKDIVSYMSLYFKQKDTDCSLFSNDGYEFPVHKELLCQTKFMWAIVKSAKLDCCRKLEIMFPTLSKDALDQIVTFLYNGQIVCNDQNDGTKALKNLTTLLGFPESMNFSQTIKDESCNEDIQMFDVPKREPNCLNDSIDVHIDQGEDQNDFEYAEKQEDSNEYSEIQPVVSIEEFDNQELITKGGVNEKSSKAGNCPHCAKYYKCLEQHILYKHETNKPWKCDQCDYAHASKYGLQEHKRYKHPSENDMKVCHICSFSSPCKSTINKHIAAVHEKLKPFSCQLCQKQFFKKSHLDKHVDYNHETNKLWKCDICDYSHASKYGLQGHKKQVHPSDNDMKVCHLCGYSSPNTSNVKAHIATVHEKIRPHSCEVCEKQFFQKAKLERHVRAVHLGEKNFKCTLCTAAYKFDADLTKHVKKVHEGVKYNCDQCHKECYSISEVKRHKLKSHGMSASKEAVPEPVNN